MPKTKLDSQSLTPLRARFVEEYLVDLNAAHAALRAGYSKRSAKNIAGELMGKPVIIAAIEAEKAKRSMRTKLTADDVIAEYRSIADADPNELCQVRRVSCRHCWGTGYRYQRTAAEFAREKAAWEERQKKSSKETFDEQGGIGYTKKRDPNPNCPECFGDGATEVFVADTRRLSRAARRLYAGVKVSKDGSVEIKMHDQMAALSKLAEHLGVVGPKDAPPPADAAEVARQVRVALHAMLAADGLRAA